MVPAAHAAPPGYLAYGDLRGHIEPCGCDPSTDLGGIKRLGAVVARERALNVGLALFNLGNNLPPEKHGTLKVPFLRETDAALAPTASLLNVLELEAMRSSAAKPEPNLVLSNANPKSKLTGAAKSVIVSPHYEIYGYTFDESVKAEVRRVDDALLAEWRKALASKSKDRSAVLLFSGSKDDLVKIAAAKLFDTIVSSNAQPFSAEAGTAERDDESRLKRSENPLVMMVPLGGQGILRGGSLLYSEAKPVSEYLKKAEETDKAKGMGLPLFKPAKLVTWLDPASAPEEGPLKPIYDRYVEAARQAFLGESQRRLKDLKDSPYASDKACASCHAEASKVYVESKHARAMATLIGKNKHEDPECVACHSVGAKETGGFVSVAASPQLANVQCENCHGPRLAHAKDVKPLATKPRVGLDFCVSCHNAQHSPKFNAAEYWKTIEHR